MTTAPINLQDLRRRLYVKAKAEPSWRFWGLYVHVCRRETLREAYRLAKGNDGAPGIDGVTFEAIEAEGVEGFVDQLREELEQRRYRPQRARKVEIPKEGGISPTFDSIDPGPGGPGSTEADPGTDLRGGLPTGVVWLSAKAVGVWRDPARGGGDSDQQDLCQGLGSRRLFRYGEASHTVKKRWPDG